MCLYPSSPKEVESALFSNSFISASVYTQDEIDKLGNAVIFLSQRIKPLTKTKLLKLVYLIEETSVKKVGLSFFNIRFDAWRLADNQWSFDLDIYLYGEWINEYPISLPNDIYPLEDIDYEIKGILSDLELTSLISCFAGSASVKRKYKRLLV